MVTIYNRFFICFLSFMFVLTITCLFDYFGFYGNDLNLWSNPFFKIIFVIGLVFSFSFFLMYGFIFYKIEVRPDSLVIYRPTGIHELKFASIETFEFGVVLIKLKVFNLENQYLLCFPSDVSRIRNYINAGTKGE